MRKTIDYVIYVFWNPYFKEFRWVVFLAPFILAYSGFLLVTFTVAEKDDLEIVVGSYQAPFRLGKIATDAYNTRVRVTNEHEERCNCDPGGRGGVNCLSENKEENRRIIYQLDGKPVEILMAKKRFYEYSRICYEFRSEGRVLVSYEKRREQYAIHKDSFNFDRIFFYVTIISFVLTTAYRSFGFLTIKNDSPQK